MSDKRLHDPATCKTSQYHWHLAPANEEGWHCSQCGGLMPGEPNGYSPKLDREEIGSKVDSILQELHAHEFLYFSNSSDGDSAVRTISEMCKAEGLYDQASIVRFAALSRGDRKYWKDLGEAIMEGCDPRKRCHCGKLATRWVGGANYCSDACEKIDRQQRRLPWEENAPWQA